MWKYKIRPIKSIAYSVGVRLLRGGDIVDLERHKLNIHVNMHTDIISEKESNC